MDWELIESKWQAMARRIRSDLKDAKTPLSKADAPKADTPRPLDGEPKARVGAAA